MMSLPMTCRRGPEALTFAVGVREADGGDVIGQRVDPDIDHVPGSPGTGMPQSNVVREMDRSCRPPGRSSRSRCGAPRQDEVGLPRRAPAASPDRPRAGRSRSAPPPTRPACRLGARRMPSSLSRLALGVIGLVAHRVPALVVVEIDVAGLVHAPPDFLRGAKWRGSVVRMKSSCEHSAAPASASNAELLSGSSAAVMPCLAAVCCIFRPCSSVPVRKYTS